MAFTPSLAPVSFGVPQPVPYAPQPDFGDMPQVRRGGMFGGNAGSILAAALAGFTARRNPAAQQALFEMMSQQRQQQVQQQAAEAQSQRELQRQIALYDYELKNPKPINNDTANDYSFWQQHLSPEQFQQYVQNKIDPPQYMNVPGVGLVQIPRGGAPSVPTAPVGKLTPIGAGGQPSGAGGFHY